MVKFDRIKTVSPWNGVLEDFNAVDFKVDQNSNGLDECWYFNSTEYGSQIVLGFKLDIRIKFGRDELVMDLSAKLLGDDYAKLISMETLPVLIHNLNATGLVNVNYQNWVNSAEIISCDVTEDLNFILSHASMFQFKNLIVNHNRWKVDEFDNGCEFYKRNRTKQRKVNFKIYNKYEELNLDRNTRFLLSLEDGVGVQNQFQNVIRMELSLRSFYTLQKYFELENRSLKVILNCENNPLEKVINEVFDLNQKTDDSIDLIPEGLSIQQLKNYLMLKEAKYDLAKLHELLKRHCSKTTKTHRLLANYRDLLHRLKVEGYSKRIGESECIEYLTGLKAVVA